MGLTDPYSEFGGCMRHTGLYYFDGSVLERRFHTDRQRPNRQQVREFFGEQPIPLGIETRD